jgi:CubicO group peptidase (beta-lactamase class C family)
MRRWPGDGRQVPGLAVAVVKNDSVIFAKGYGVQPGAPGR